jgi:hypothetical protein
MRYILEIVVQKKDATWECVDTIESESAIPIPAVGDEVLTPQGWLARVDNRQFWYTYLNRIPLAKIEIRCRRVAEPAPPEVTKTVRSTNDQSRRTPRE